MSITVGADMIWEEAQAMLRWSEARFEAGDVWEVGNEAATRYFDLS